MAEYKRKAIPLTNLDCPSCVLALERELGKLEGVGGVYVNLLMRRVIVDYDPSKIGERQLEEKVEKLGYRIAYKTYESLPQKMLKRLGVGESEERLEKLGDLEFEDHVLRSAKPVAVIFTLSGCPLCKVMLAKLKELAEKFRDKVYVYEVDIAETRRWEDYRVVGAPTIIYFKGGTEVGRLIGFADDEELEAKLSGLTKN